MGKIWERTVFQTTLISRTESTGRVFDYVLINLRSFSGVESLARMGYQVVFDASRSGSQLAIYLLIPVFALIPGLIGWALKDSTDPKEASKGKFFLIVSAAGFCLSLLLLAGNFAEYYRVKKALQSGDYEVTEGTVRNFIPMPPGGHSTESFDIGKTSFQYPSGWGSIVFNSEWNRGYIHDGVKLRIASNHGDILRVEVSSR